MRPVFVTNTSSAADVGYNPDAGTRIFAVNVKARAANAGNWYIGTDSSLSSAAGYELTPGDALTLSYEELKGNVKATAFWGVSTDSGDVLDWAFTVED